MRKALGTVLVAASTVAATAQPALAQPHRVVVIVMENEPYGHIVGSSKAPYINSLIAAGKLFTNYEAVVKGSLHDYLAMTSGLTSKLSPPSDNVFQAMDASGTVGWTAFEESMSGNCGAGSVGNVPGTSVALYTKGHDPAFQYRKNETCSLHDVPMTTSTFKPATLPDFSYVVPNRCDDGATFPQNGGTCPAYFGSNSASSQIAMGDAWLSHVVPLLLAEPDITVILTWDEGSDSSSPPQHIVTLEVGAGVAAGSTDDAAYDHYGLEAGLYAYFGLGTAPHNGAAATPLPIP